MSKEVLTTESAYNVGDKVYIMCEGQLKFRKVQEVEAKVSRGSKVVVYNFGCYDRKIEADVSDTIAGLFTKIENNYNDTQEEG